ncbi:hypothetical protein [Pseudomonas sp. PA1(2017)]|uniref:hypothetical protein n=1 Tax=Pseudomonas sp. PA1(2017) TaxID=1932113 RepID=UPI0011150795|nr:hypothetical protein [Pseudomonas sp. PA1(2017)]
MMKVYGLSAKLERTPQPLGFDRQLEGMAGAAQTEGITVEFIDDMTVRTYLGAVYLKKDIGTRIKRVVRRLDGNGDSLSNGSDTARSR